MYLGAAIEAMMKMHPALFAHSSFADTRGLTPLGDTPASTPSMLSINATASECPAQLFYAVSASSTGNFTNSASSTPSPVPSSSGKESLAGESHKESRNHTQTATSAKRQQRLEKNRSVMDI